MVLSTATANSFCFQVKCAIQTLVITVASASWSRAITIVYVHPYTKAMCVKVRLYTV